MIMGNEEFLESETNARFPRKPKPLQYFMKLRHWTPVSFCALLFAWLLLKKRKTLLHQRGKERKFWKDWKDYREFYYDASNVGSESNVLESERHFYTLLNALQQIVEYGSAPSSTSPLHLTPILGSLESKLHKIKFDRESYVKDALTALTKHHLVKDCEEYPIASGLIAQIHRGRLNNGTEVAVKLRHENIKSKLQIQYRELTDFACFLIENGMEVGSSANSVLAKFSELLEQETDLIVEGRNYRLMQTMLLKYHHECQLNLSHTLRIPNLVPELSKEHLLVAERVNGVPFLDARSINEETRYELLCSMLRFFGFLILQEGFFPCDPHAANLIISRDPETDLPQIVLIDFGQVTTIDSSIRVKLAHIILALAADDDDRVVKALDEISLKENSIPSRIARNCALHLFDTVVDSKSSDLDKNVDPQIEVNRLHLPLDFYFVIRVIGILRNLVNAFDLKLAVSELWEDIALKVIEQELRDNGIVPSFTTTEDDEESTTTTELETHSNIIINQSEAASEFSFPRV